MSVIRHPPANHILKALSPSDWDLLKPHLLPVDLPCRFRMQFANQSIQTVFFIESGLVSIVASGGRARAQAEVGVIGREGMTGLPVVLGAERSPCEAFIQIAGSGLSIESGYLQQAMARSATLSRSLTRFAHVFSIQGHYTALANAHGKIEQRLARWLLMAHDRVESDEFPLTHEFLALMLGVRRAGVTTALQGLEHKAVIGVARKSITICDRAGLERYAAGYYGQPEAEFKRLFPATEMDLRVVALPSDGSAVRPAQSSEGFGQRSPQR